MIKAILFDFNGVIINDERIHLQAYRQVLEAEGVALSDEDYFASLGMDDVAFVRAAFARGNHTLSEETLHAVIECEYEIHRQLIGEDLPVSSGVVTFIKEASRHYQLGVVSMAVLSEIKYVLALAGLSECFSFFVSAEPGLKHKPAPDSYLRGLDLLNDLRRANRQLPALANECVVIEDAPPGILAARGAGMRTIGITNTVSEAALRKAGADVVTPNLGDWNIDSVNHLFD